MDEPLKLDEVFKNLIKEAVKEAVKEVSEEMKLNNCNCQKIMSQKELAEYLGVSQSWVSVNKDKLSIPHFEAGGSKFLNKDIEKWIEDNKDGISIENKDRISILRHHSTFKVK
jgi:predicted XRE-type DNA-binding protein